MKENEIGAACSMQVGTTAYKILVQDRAQWQALVNIVLNLHAS
jgi:hypothetical protein